MTSILPQQLLVDALIASSTIATQPRNSQLHKSMRRHYIFHNVISDSNEGSVWRASSCCTPKRRSVVDLTFLRSLEGNTISVTSPCISLTSASLVLLLCSWSTQLNASKSSSTQACKRNYTVPNMHLRFILRSRLHEDWSHTHQSSTASSLCRQNKQRHDNVDIDNLPR